MFYRCTEATAWNARSERVNLVKKGLTAWAGIKGLGGTSVTGKDLGLGEVQPGVGDSLL